MEAVARRKSAARVRLFLCIISGTMLGFSFPPSHVGILACFGLVPLLIVLADIQKIGTSLRYSYVALLVFHIITLNWTGGYAHAHDVYMMIAGACTMLLHPFFYFVPIGAYLFVKKHAGDKVAIAALPFIWVGYEYAHSLSEWSFPWLTIGNTQSYDITRIQFISTTGVYGLSLWILIINVLAFVLYSQLAQNKWKPVSKQSIALVAILLVIYFLPSIYGNSVLSHVLPQDQFGKLEGQKTITVGMVQSNIDPWEKWKQTGSNDIQLYLGLTRSIVESNPDKRPDLVLWPETAIPYYILTDANRLLLTNVREQLRRMDVSVLTGLPQAVYYEDSTKAPPSAKRSKSTGERYDVYNAAAFIQPDVEEIPWYGKMKMVPLAERVPYADAFYVFDFLRWGVGIGGWQIGRDSVIFVEHNTGTRFNALICYESVYPDLVAAFVKKGSEFIALITIDSWWAKMSGAYQHQQFAIFRAVENRRWIARCAVGGISCYIDPYGRVYDKTALFTQTTLVRTIGRNNEITFYTEHGDWLSHWCLGIGGLFLMVAVGQKIKT